MKEDNADYIEQLLTDTFDDYSVPEFKNSWPTIKNKVFRKQFFKFNPYQFNAYYGIVAAATMITAGILLFSPSEPEKASIIPVEVKDTLGNPVADDAISKEEIVEEVPEISKKDTLYKKSDDDALKPVNSVVSVSKIEATEGLKADSTSLIKSEESNMETNYNPTGIIEKEDLKLDMDDDSFKTELITPIDSIDSIVNDLDSLSGDTLGTDKKKIIIVEPPVVKRDTIVKIIRERRRR